MTDARRRVWLDFSLLDMKHYMALKKETDTWMYLISYTALSDNITAEGRQRGTTTVEYFTKQSVKVKKDKDTPSEDWHDSRVLYFWNRLTKQNRESKWKTEGCEAEGASTRYLLTWWKVHFSGRWQEINEENRRKYDNMTEHKESTYWGWTQR